MILDEPTNHLDADSVVWLREFLKNYKGGLIVISHDVELVDETVNRVFYLDANRKVIDVYNMNWKNYLRQRVADEERRKKERVNVEKKATQLQLQAARFGAKASKAAAAHQMVRARREDAVRPRRGAHGRPRREAALPRAGSLRQDAARGGQPVEVLRVARDLHRCRPRDRPRARRSSCSDSTARARRRCCGSSPASTSPTPAQVEPGHGLKIGYYAQEHETIDVKRSVLENMVSAAPHLTETEARQVLGSFLFTGDDSHKPAGVLSGGEKTRLSLAMIVVSGANVLLLDEPTNNLDPASREEILDALAHYAGAVVLVCHDEGAVEALNPERVLILPDGVEDLWSRDYAELISLA